MLITKSQLFPAFPTLILVNLKHATRCFNQVPLTHFKMQQELLLIYWFNFATWYSISHIEALLFTRNNLTQLTFHGIPWYKIMI
jgi:hypothetical protein